MLAKIGLEFGTVEITAHGGQLAISQDPTNRRYDDRGQAVQKLKFLKSELKALLSLLRSAQIAMKA